MLSQARKSVRNSQLREKLVAIAKWANDPATYWGGYDSVVTRRFGRKADPAVVAQKSIPDQMADELLKEFTAGERVSFRLADHAVGYIHSDDPNVEQQTKGKFEWVVLKGSALQAASKLWDHIRPSAEEVLGAPLEVVNTKVQWIYPGVGATGSNAWHTDGFPPQFFKILVYLSPLAQGGGTEVRFPDGRVETVGGRKGQWALFNPSLMHRGTSSPTQERITVELTIVRRLRSGSRLYFGGTNSAYPRFPWTRLPHLA